jgi:hypothetical protein
MRGGGGGLWSIIGEGGRGERGVNKRDDGRINGGRTGTGTMGNNAK